MRSLTYLLALLPLTTAQFSNFQLGLPPSLRIASMTHSGNGCEDQSSSPLELNEQNQLDIRTFLSMTARKGTGTAASEAVKECDIYMKLRYNKGEQFAVYSERVFAPISLKKGMEAVQDTSLAYGSFTGLQTSAGIVSLVSFFMCTLGNERLMMPIYSNILHADGPKLKMTSKTILIRELPKISSRT
jgi:hypothetical protein